MGGSQSRKFDNSKWIGVKNEALDARYDIVRVLGKGAGGTAYLVKAKADGRELVAKESHDITPEGVKEFVQEFESMKNFVHPNIVKVHELLQGQQVMDGKVKPQIILISELARGGDLHGYMKKAMEVTQLTEEWTAKVFQKAMKGVAHLHDRQMMHNDLKPDNILMLSAFDEANPDVVPEVVITDFGCATLLKDRKLACGDPRYAGPETWNIIKAILADERVSAADVPLFQADLWAMGAMLYELLSGGLIAFAYRPVTLDECQVGEPVFEELRDAVLGPDEIRVREEGVNASEEAEDLLKRMFQKDYTKRPTAQDVLQHKWFSIKGHVLDERATAKLALRTIKNKAHAILLNAMATKLQREHYQDCWTIFQKVDEDNTGQIDEKEFTKAYKMLAGTEAKASICSKHKHQRMTTRSSQVSSQPDSPVCADHGCDAEEAEAEAKEALEAFKHADINKDGEIDFNEFLAATFDWSSLDKSVLQGALKEVFEHLDGNGGGGIDRDELRGVFGGALTAVQLDDTFRQIDRDGDGSVSLEELEHFLFKPQTEEDLARFNTSLRESARSSSAGGRAHDDHADKCCTCLSLSVVAGVVLQYLSKVGALQACMALL